MSRTGVVRTWIIALAALTWVLSMSACSGSQQSETSAQQQETASGDARGTAPEGAPPVPGTSDTMAEATPQTTAAPEAPPLGKAATPAPTPATPAPTTPVPTAATSAPAAPPATEAPPQASQPAPASSAPAPKPSVTPVAVPATKPGLTRVGVDRCKMCHRLQYNSWAASAHATGKPALLDCESCHGPGSEYAKITIMRDPEKAKAAGLVIPGKSFCTESCHSAKWQDDMLQRVHAHKADATGS